MRLTLWPDPRQPAADVLALARQAEAAGWHGIRFGDDAGNRGPALECWATLGAIATTVPRLRLEAIVAEQCGRHPAVVAKQAVTTDLLSGGRLVLGLTGENGALLEEACLVVLSLVSSERATFHGQHFQLINAPFEPKPQARPLPLLTWGDGTEAGARLAARLAHHWSVSGSPGDVHGQLSELRRACHEIGRHPAEITVSATADLPADDDGRAATLEEYAEVGVDEWVVPDRVLGDDHRQRLAGLRLWGSPAPRS